MNDVSHDVALHAWKKACWRTFAKTSTVQRNFTPNTSNSLKCPKIDNI